MWDITSDTRIQGAGRAASKGPKAIFQAASWDAGGFSSRPPAPSPPPLLPSSPPALASRSGGEGEGERGRGGVMGERRGGEGMEGRQIYHAHSPSSNNYLPSFPFPIVKQ